jgi:hypothetical protein
MISIAAALAAARNPIVPRVVSTPAGLTVTLPAKVLQHDDVRKQLRSGLTTTFLVHVAAIDRGGHELRGGASISVRYDLWDEKYIVTTIDGAGHESERNVASHAQLLAVWTTEPLLVLRAQGAAFSAPANVTIEVVPFSRDEEADARRWLSQPAHGNAANGSGIVPESRLLEFIVGTSVRRRPLLEFHWRVAVERP